jgi:tRNA threonylcarbamoyl adenosine modification protein (Sua5/YciO/YrdC/YwlC family)
MLLKIYEENPSAKAIQNVVQCLSDGGIIIYPTDTVYGLGCSIHKPKAVEKISQIKGIPLSKANFSLICNNLSDLSTYAKPLNNDYFKIMKRCLPGPYTFILPATVNVPKLFMSKKRSIGIRIPGNNIIQAIVSELGHPIMSTSIKIDRDDIEYTTNPELIHERYNNQVDIVIDGGYGDIEGSTILDCTGDIIEIVREGKGNIDFLLAE